MPLQKLQFKPGVNRESTNYANEGGYYDCDKIRFRSGQPEKLGGWTRFSSNQYLGICRSLWNWSTLGGANYLGLGTSKKYYIEYGSTYYDVTPHIYSDSPALTGPFSASVANGATITVTDGQYTPNVGDYINITGAVGLGGNITAAVLNKEYVVTQVGSGTYKVVAYSSQVRAGSFVIGQSYTIQYFGTTDFTLYGAASNTLGLTFTATGVGVGSGIAGVPVLANASDTGTGGSAVVVKYQYPVGNDFSTVGNGWGTGPWSRGGWGSGYTSGIVQQLRLWSNDNYGQDLVIAPRGGAIAYWSSAGTVNTRAVPLTTLAGVYAPLATNQVVASAIQRFVIAMGANPYIPGTPNTTFDPMLVRWSDQEDPLEWVPAAVNQAGEFRLSNGSFIMQSIATRQEILIWTDSALYSMQYLGAPYVWGFNILADNISSMSPKSAITVNNVTYWMGKDKFYVYSGRVETLPCTLRQYVFNDINQDQAFQVFAGSNEGYNEVWWFYCSANSNVVDKYVIYNYLDNAWYYGTMGRTAWLDSGIQPYPIAANYEDRLLNHEQGTDDVSGTQPLPIVAYVQSSDFDIGDGYNFGFVWRILPDVNFNGSTENNPSVTMTIKPRQNSGTPYGAADNPQVISDDEYKNQRAYNIQLFTGQVYTRIRGRQMAFRIESTGIGVAWQLGSPRIDIRPDGRR